MEESHEGAGYAEKGNGELGKANKGNANWEGEQGKEGLGKGK